MGSGSSSFKSQVEQASVAGLKQVVADLGPEEVEKVKAALHLARAKKSRVRVKCGERTFAPFGMRTDLADGPAVTKEFKPYKRDALPEKVDLRKYMSPVEDQSNTNSCCANAVAGAMEYINQKHARETGDKPGDISRLFIYYVGRKIDMGEEEKMWGGKGTKSKTAAPKDDGMSVSAAITAVQTAGSCLEPTWPYDLANVNEKPTDECFKEAKKFRVAEARRLYVDLDMMRECLAEGNPIVFGLMLTDRFFCPGPSGYIPTPGKTDQRAANHGLHAMLLVGYNDRQSVFIVRNSWGENWGQGGYCYLGYDYVASRDFNLCQMYAITGLTNADFTPDADDGENFDIQDDAEDVTVIHDVNPNPTIFEILEMDEEEDADDGFDFSEGFQGDQAVRQYFLDQAGVLNRSQFQICLSLFHRGEAGKNFDWLAASDWVDDDSKHPDHGEVWTPKDFQEVVTMFHKESDAEKFPNLAFLLQ